MNTLIRDHPMSPLAIMNPTILDTVLARLAVLFLLGADSDLTVARYAARQMLTAHNIETEEELRLAAEIISFGFHALEALSQAADPALSLNKILRLRGGAVSLSREAHKSQRKLDQLQRARRAGAQPQPAGIRPGPAASQACPGSDGLGVENVLDILEATRAAMQMVQKDGGQSWSRSYQKRETAKCFTENLKKSQARNASHAAHSVDAAAGAPLVRPAA